MKAKILSILEVSVVFILVVYLFRLAAAAPLPAKISSALGGYLFPAYAFLLAAALALYGFRVLSRHSIPSSRKLKVQLAITGYGFFPMLILSAALNWINWKTWGGAVLVAFIALAMLVWFARLVKDRPLWQKTAVAAGFLLFPVGAQILTRLGTVVVSILYFYLFVALSEEIFFRGYIQSTLNAAFNRPCQFWGITFGWGLILSSVFFGLWHVGGNAAAISWPQVLWTIFAGMFLGLVREKSDSVIAPALLHGIMNYGPQAILFSLLWN